MELKHKLKHRVVWVFFTSDNSLVIFIVINHIFILDLLYLFIYLFIYVFMYLFFAFIYIYSLYTFAMYCIALLQHMYLAMHYIACCICIFPCIALHAPAYALSSALHCILLHMYFYMHCMPLHIISFSFYLHKGVS